MKADILPLLAFRHYHSSLCKLYADSRYADILRVLIHLKPETPLSSGPLLVGTRLFLGRKAFIPHLSDTMEGVFAVGETCPPANRQHQKEFPGLWMTGIPDRVGVGLPKVANIFIFAGVSGNLEASAGTEITGA